MTSVIRVLALVMLTACSSRSQPVSGARAHHYEATYRFFADQPDGSSDCGKARLYGTTSGYLEIRPHGANDFSIHWEGVGCDVIVVGQAEGPWSAENQPCALSQNSLGPFGVTAIDLDMLTYDPGTEVFAAKGKMIRSESGSSFCFEVPGP
jgi:hypothetical protein